MTTIRIADHDWLTAASGEVGIPLPQSAPSTDCPGLPDPGVILPTPPGCCWDACHHGQCTPGGSTLSRCNPLIRKGPD